MKTLNFYSTKHRTNQDNLFEENIQFNDNAEIREYFLKLRKKWNSEVIIKEQSTGFSISLKQIGLKPTSFCFTCKSFLFIGETQDNKCMFCDSRNIKQ